MNELQFDTGRSAGLVFQGYEPIFGQPANVYENTRSNDVVGMEYSLGYPDTSSPEVVVQIEDSKDGRLSTGTVLVRDGEEFRTGLDGTFRFGLPHAEAVIMGLAHTALNPNRQNQSQLEKLLN